jgi:hypothetical protein
MLLTIVVSLLANENIILQGYIFTGETVTLMGRYAASQLRVNITNKTPKELPVAQLVNKFPTYFGNRKFIILFTKFRNVTLT